MAFYYVLPKGPSATICFDTTTAHCCAASALVIFFFFYMPTLFPGNKSLEELKEPPPQGWLPACAEPKKDPSVSRRSYGEQKYLPGSLTLARRQGTQHSRQAAAPFNKYFTAENGRLGEKMEGRVQPVTQGDVTGPCLAGLEAT